MQKWMIEHALVVQKMAQVAAAQSTKRKREGGSEGRGGGVTLEITGGAVTVKELSPAAGLWG